MDIAIETQHLTKQFERPRGWRKIVRFQPTTAVDDVNLQVRRGELFGLLGPNGAGKTTLVKMLCTLVRPSAGSATVAGHSLQEFHAIRASVGLVVSDERSFYWRLTGRENLKFFAAMYRLHGAAADERIDDVLERVEMEQWADERFSNYSSGMKQRLAIARSMLHRPQILFLDEPSRSLDPAATRRLHKLLTNLVQEQAVTIFLITHDLAEAEKLCDRVALINEGRIRAVGSPMQLRDQLARRLHYTVRVDALPDGMVDTLHAIVPDLRVRQAGNFQHLSFEAVEADETLSAVLDCLHQQQMTIYSIEGSPPTLEEVFAHFVDCQDAEDGHETV